MTDQVECEETQAEASDILVGELRRKCLTRGFSNLKCFGTAFRQFDKDYSKAISFKEFRAGLQQYGIPITEDEQQGLFKMFDKDGSGMVDFQEFYHALTPPLEGRRLEVVKYVFELLDSSGDGFLQTADIAGLFAERAKQHEKYQNGEWTVQQVVDNLLSAFEQEESRDGVVSLQEFVKYYSFVSSCVQDDASFEVHLKGSWGVE